MKIEISNKLSVSGCREDTLRAIGQALTMPNPKYADAERRLSFSLAAGDRRTASRVAPKTRNERGDRHGVRKGGRLSKDLWIDSYSVFRTRKKEG